MQVAIRGFVTGPEIFERVPQSASIIASIIGTAARIESEWVSILASLTHAEVDASVALWKSLRGVQAQDRAILEIARLKLETDEIDLLKHVLKRLERHRRTRDRFAHGVWASTSGKDTQLVLLTGQALAAYSARVFGGGDFFDRTLIIDERDIYGSEQFQKTLNEAGRAQATMSALSTYFVVSRVLRCGNSQETLASTLREIDKIWAR